MKSWTMHAICAAAALVTVTGTSQAQSLHAQIPFAFRAGNVMMQPGQYELVRFQGSNAASFMLRNRDTFASVMLSPFGGRTPSRRWVAVRLPRFAFDCGGTRCALREVWVGGTNTFRLAPPRRSS